MQDPETGFVSFSQAVTQATRELSALCRQHTSRTADLASCTDWSKQKSVISASEDISCIVVQTCRETEIFGCQLVFLAESEKWINSELSWTMAK